LETDAVPEPGRKILGLLTEQIDELEKRVAQVDAEILAWHRANQASQRLAKVPGIGPLIASAIVATVADASMFRSGREFSAWLGLVPRQNSTGGKQRLGRITHQGDGYIRRLLIIGAQSALQGSREVKANGWVQGLLSRYARLKVAVALANKMARIAWALMTKGEVYRPAVVLTA
jgi:transposase